MTRWHRRRCSSSAAATRRSGSWTDLTASLFGRYEVVGVETQGSRWRHWLMATDSLVISPKPPSSDECTPRHWDRFERFMEKSALHPNRVLKMVVFDEDDLDWARGVHECYADVPLYLFGGPDPDPQGFSETYAETVSGVGERYRWLCEAVAAEPRLHAARVLPQLHVVAWGHRVGV